MKLWNPFTVDNQRYQLYFQFFSNLALLIDLILIYRLWNPALIINAKKSIDKMISKMCNIYN